MQIVHHVYSQYNCIIKLYFSCALHDSNLIGMSKLREHVTSTTNKKHVLSVHIIFVLRHTNCVVNLNTIVNFKT
jgi:hypothetical protein